MKIRLAPVVVCTLGLLLVMSGRTTAGGATTNTYAQTNGTAGTDGTTTSTTCSSSGTTTGTLNLNTAYSEPALTAVSGAEHVSQTSYSNSNGSVVSASKHVMTVSVLESNGWLTPNADSETSFWDSAAPTSSQTRFGNANPPQNVPAGLGRPGGLSQGTVRPGGTDLTFYVAQPGEMPVSGTAVSVPIATGGVTTPGLSNPLATGGTAQFSAASTAVLPGQTVTTVLKIHKWWHTLDTVTNANNCGVRDYYWIFHDTTYYRRFDFSLNKLLAQASSIDTRRVYGQPDLDGEYPEDANAPQRNLNFDPWQWKGGMFAGNMPSSTGDNSGLSRIQLYPGGTWDSTSQLPVLSMMYLGFPASPAVGSNTLLAFLPSASDPNLNLLPTQVNWSNAWNPANGTNGPSLTFTSSTATQDYACWNMPAYAMSVTDVGIRMATEDTTQTVWCYFGSPSYAAQFSTFPLDDSEPRVWLVDLAAVTQWTN